MTIEGGEGKAEQIVKLTLPVDNSRDHIQGPPTAPVTLLEYGDYQCPYCGQAYPIIKQVQKHLADKLRFVFRNFPITQIHPHAQHAAEAAESAAAQNRFWEMHDHLYEHQQALDDNQLEKYASKLGLDLARFNHDMSSDAHSQRIPEASFYIILHGFITPLPVIFPSLSLDSASVACSSLNLSEVK